MKGKNRFVGIGYVWLGFGTFYAYAVNRQYGSSLPKTVEEWLAEIFVGMLLAIGTTFILVGVYLGDKK